MPVADKTTLQTELPVQGGGASPPTGPDENRGGDGPNGDRARLMLLIHNTRDHTASLDYLRGWSGLTRVRVWRAYEELEDAGYVEPLEKDPRGRVGRWLDARRGENDRVFASTFLRLTEAGCHSPELEALITVLEDARRDRKRSAGTQASISEGLRQIALQLRSRFAEAAGAIVRTERTAGNHEDSSREARKAPALLNPVVYGMVAICTAGLLGCVLALVATS